jgi:GTP-binding protein LepA
VWRENNTTNYDDRMLISIQEHLHLLDKIPLEDVRSFCFVAHVDAGKSSLSSRVLELAGNLGRDSQIAALLSASHSSSGGGGGSGGGHDAASGSISAAAGVGANANNNGAPNRGGESVGLPSSPSSSFIKQKEQIELLDTLKVEQQRGITVKASAATMLYPHPSAVGPTGLLLLNLYDTPGHVDFGSEVTRSLCFVEGAVLLLDATRGIQAQTWSVRDKARALKLPLLVALTKVDLEAARPEHVALSAAEWLTTTADANNDERDEGIVGRSNGGDDSGSIDPDRIILTSARSRIGIRTLLDAICEHMPAPSRLPDDVDTTASSGDDNEGSSRSMLRAQVVDSWYDSRGVNCLVRVLSGVLSEGERISIIANSQQHRPVSLAPNVIPSYSVQEVGIVVPGPVRTARLRIG